MRTRDGPIRQSDLLSLWIPKVETHYEAKWWGEAFTLIENYFSVPIGTMKGA
jgi:malate synthase